MALILNIDSSTKTASVSLSENGEIVQFAENHIQKDHSAFLHQAIKEIMTRQKVGFNQLSAIAATHGPGSYTGLRVGMATAKGLCYAASLPLILVGTLPCIAKAAVNKAESIHDLFCAMLDARRMEVFTALYNNELNEVIPPSALILDADSFKNYTEKKIIFAGDGVEKFQKISTATNWEYYPQINIVQSLAQLSFQYFNNREFASLAYSTPFYLKEFQST